MRTATRGPDMPALGLVTALALVLSAQPIAAEVGLQLEVDVGAMVHEAFDAQHLRARLSWVGREPRFDLAADHLLLPEPVGALEDVRIRCPRVEIIGKRITCADARISARGNGWGLESAALDFDWDRETGFVRFAAPWPGLFGGRGQISGRVGAAGLRLDFALARLDLARLVRSGWLPAEIPVAVAAGDLAISGYVDSRGRASDAQLNLAVTGLSFSDPSGLRAGEEVALSGALAHGADGLEIQVRFTDGAVFFEPWFVDFAETGLVVLSVSSLLFLPSATEHLAWRAAAAEAALGGHTRVRGMRLSHSGARLEEGEIEWQVQRLDLAGSWFAEPLLAGTLLGRTAFEGETTGSLRVSGGVPRAMEAEWQGMGLRDRLGRFALEDARGRAVWSDDHTAGESRLSLHAGEMLGLPIGPFEARFQMEPRGVRLLEPLFLPVLDGGPGVDRFHLTLAPDGPEIELEGGIRALSLEPLTEILGWPRFTGKLAGVIPRVFYDIDGLRVDGRILVQVFDGELILRDLRVRNLFRVAPELEVSAEVRRLDLERITSAFDLGRIEGRLSGAVEDLLLVDWIPERMRFFLSTPEEDPGRRRISQRAVENLTAIGGGIQGLLTTTFLRVFDEFTYRKLGFGCDLEGEVCVATGVADLPDGSFSLVQGGGLPRIDVIGHNRRVDWPELVRRLNAVREAQAPVVQ